MYRTRYYAIYVLPELMAFADSRESSVTAAEWLRRTRWQRLVGYAARFYVMIVPLLPLTKTAGCHLTETVNDGNDGLLKVIRSNRDGSAGMI